MEITKVSQINHLKNHIDFQTASADSEILQIISIFPELSPKIPQILFLYYCFTKLILFLNILYMNLNSSNVHAIFSQYLQSETFHSLSFKNLDPAPKL